MSTARITRKFVRRYAQGVANAALALYRTTGSYLPGKREVWDHTDPNTGDRVILKSFEGGCNAIVITSQYGAWDLSINKHGAGLPSSKCALATSFTD